MKRKSILLFILPTAFMLLSASCGRDSEPLPDIDATVPAESTLTIVPQETTQPPTPLDDTKALRILAFAYWEALNLYDLEKAVSYLEENYLEVHRDEVKKGISQMKLFGVQLGLSEESQPRFTGTNEAEMFMTLKEPLGTRRILMEFAKVEGEWMITFAEEID